MNDRVLRFPLTADQVIPTSYSQSHLGPIDEWSSTKDFTLNALLSDDKHLFKRFAWTLACIRDQAQRVPRVSHSHVVKKMPN